MSRLVWIGLGLVGIAAIFAVASRDDGPLAGFGSDAVAQVAYMSIWGALVASAVLASGTSFGQMLKQIVIWIGIFLVLMTGYTYRYELQDTASALTAGLIPGSPLASRTADGRQQVTLVKSANGHFSARGTANGKSIRFLVDTGASSVVLTNAAAARAGIDVDQLAFTIPVTTANGRTTAAPARLDELSIGPIARRNVPVTVARAGVLEENLLGMDFVDTLTGFEIRGDRLILTD